MGKDKTELIEENFPAIDFSQMNDLSGDCLMAVYNQNLEQLAVVNAECDSPLDNVCMTQNYNDVRTCEKEIIHWKRLDILLNPSLKKSKIAGVSPRRAEIKDMIARLNQTSAFHALFSTLWFASLPCYDTENVTALTNGERAVLKYCEWKGRKISCAAIF